MSKSSPDPLQRPDGRPSKVTLAIAKHVIYIKGDEDNGVQPNDFVNRLWALMVSADEMNLERIRLGFPGYVEAFEAVQRSPLWGFDWIRNAVLDAQVKA